ncbi:MAG: ROK family protein [Chloroflexia bacterium]
MNKGSTGRVMVAEAAVTEATPIGLSRPTTQPLEWSGVLAQKGYVFGADISVDSERVVLADLSGNVVDRIYSPVDAGTSVAPEDVVARVSGMMHALLEKHNVKIRKVLRAAVGFGGPVDALRGEVRRHHDAPGWEGFPLAQKLEAALDVPTYLENDARLATLGEVWFGAGRETAECDMVYVHWSTGVGGGIVTDGKLLRGSATIAGEFGHTVVVTGDTALPCRCGGKGHLEAYIRGTSLLSRARDLVGDSAAPTDIAGLFEMARSNPEVQGLLDEAVALMGVTVANLITQINPNLVVIGGLVARHADVLIPRISEIALQLAMPLSTTGVTIVPAQLGDEATLMGAVALALDSLR